jgi:hypothetical protein
LGRTSVCAEAIAHAVRKSSSTGFFTPSPPRVGSTRHHRPRIV